MLLQGLNKTGLLLTEDLSEQPGSYTSTAQIGLATPEYAGSDAFPGANKGDSSGDIQIEDQVAPCIIVSVPSGQHPL